jgi:hypothetical protein
MRNHLTAIITALTCSLGASQVSASEPYTRVRDLPDGKIALEMCTRTFEPSADHLPRIHMVSAIHVADIEYYAAMQELLETYDTVLFEGIKPAGLDPIDPDLDDASIANATQERLDLLVQIAQMYRASHGDFPRTVTDLAQSDDKRIASLVASIRLDGWGNPIESMHTITNASGSEKRYIEFISLGADASKGGEGVNADLSSASDPIDPSATPPQPPEGIQTQLANALRVSFQLDEMDTSNPEWINADMDINQLQRSLAEYGEDSSQLLSMLEGESFSAKVAGFILNFVARSPQLSSMMKLMVMDMLQFAEESDLLSQQMDASFKVIVDGRNNVVIEYLEDTIADHPEHKDIAIFYGAGHMVGLEESLIEMGYTPAGDQWTKAMTVNPEDTGLSKMQIQMMRNMMKSSLKQQMGR